MEYSSITPVEPVGTTRIPSSPDKRGHTDDAGLLALRLAAADGR